MVEWRRRSRSMTIAFIADDIDQLVLPEQALEGPVRFAIFLPRLDRERQVVAPGVWAEECGRRTAALTELSGLSGRPTVVFHSKLQDGRSRRVLGQ